MKYLRVVNNEIDLLARVCVQIEQPIRRVVSGSARLSAGGTFPLAEAYIAGVGQGILHFSARKEEKNEKKPTTVCVCRLCVPTFLVARELPYQSGTRQT